MGLPIVKFNWVKFHFLHSTRNERENMKRESILEKRATSVYGKDEGIWVYVGTYHKYNSGNLFGRWLCLNDFNDEHEFVMACEELHKDEEDPELMFQDYEGPKCFYGESGLNEQVWEFLNLDSDDQEVVRAYIENRELRDFNDIKDNYHGTFATAADYVQDYWEQCGDFKPDEKCWWHPSNYTDWERMADDLERSGDVDFIVESDGVMVFSAF